MQREHLNYEIEIRVIITTDFVNEVSTVINCDKNR